MIPQREAAVAAARAAAAQASQAAQAAAQQLQQQAAQAQAAVAAARAAQQSAGQVSQAAADALNQGVIQAEQALGQVRAAQAAAAQRAQAAADAARRRIEQEEAALRAALAARDAAKPPPPPPPPPLVVRAPTVPDIPEFPGVIPPKINITPPTQGQLEKATITNLDNTGEKVECLFRPKEYSFSKKNNWTPGKMVGSNFEQPTFNGSDPQTLRLELIFDTFEEGTDVRRRTEVLWSMMKLSPQRIEPTTNRGVPPHIEFRWGKLGSFEAVITSLSEKFTLFHPSGYPLRSYVTIDLLQATASDTWARQNPTSGARQGYAVHTVKEGETIDWIAFKEYGSSDAYRHLAAANGIDDPTRLMPGQRLLIVPLND
jgi:nucleoid-associated protein YgaU